MDVKSACGLLGGPLKETFQFPKDLALRIPGKHDTTCVGTVLDMRTGDGRRLLVAEFPPPGTPLFAIGDIVPLTFQGPSLGRKISTEARTVFWSFNDATFRYGFEIDMSTKESLLTTIHGNRARRVGFTREAPIPVLVTPSPGSGEFQGTLQNISVGGLGALLPPKADEALRHSYELTMRFSLPGTDGGFLLTGRTRSRTLVGANVLYGAQFEHREADDTGRQLTRIERFVASREGDS